MMQCNISRLKQTNKHKQVTGLFSIKAYKIIPDLYSFVSLGEEAKDCDDDETNGNRKRQKT